MKVSELMMMTYEEVKEIERQLWADWEIASNVLKVLEAMKREEE
tara:strand:- start:406 stop:537 length:132 start_codon:yes stop_codon:yes gene_type:complete